MKKILLTALLFPAVYSYSQNLVLHYKLNDLTSTTMPANNLSIYGTGDDPIIADSSSSGLISDSCFKFNIGKGFVSDVALDNHTWTATAISVWYKSSSVKQGTIIQGSHMGFGMRITNEGYAQAFFNGTQIAALESSVIVTDGLWHHLFAQSDGENTYIYIDGVLNATKPDTLYTLPSPNDSAKVYIGNAINDEYTQKIDGYLDEVRIYSDTLSTTQINDLMNGVLSVNVNEQTKQRIQLYPNPVNDIITIQTDATIISNSIFDIAGNLIATFKGNKYSVSHLTNGVYFITIQTKSGMAQYKFVKQ